VDQVGRKSETTFCIASLDFEISAFSPTATDQLKLPSRPTPATGNGVEGRALTRQRVTAAVGCPKSVASLCRRQRRMAMPMAPDPSAAS
jgi:hypothetical protein